MTLLVEHWLTLKREPRPTAKGDEEEEEEGDKQSQVWAFEPAHRRAPLLLKGYESLYERRDIEMPLSLRSRQLQEATATFSREAEPIKTECLIGCPRHNPAWTERGADASSSSGSGTATAAAAATSSADQPSQTEGGAASPAFSSPVWRPCAQSIPPAEAIVPAISEEFIHFCEDDDDTGGDGRTSSSLMRDGCTTSAGPVTAAAAGSGSGFVNLEGGPASEQSSRALCSSSLAAAAAGSISTGTVVNGEAPCTGRAAGLLIVVCDSGPGVPETELTKLFKPFSQLDAGLSYKGRGTGLGLAISREIVVRHGGCLGVVSEQGKGSDFYVRLPLRELERNATTERLCFRLSDSFQSSAGSGSSSSGRALTLGSASSSSSSRVSGDVSSPQLRAVTTAAERRITAPASAASAAVAASSAHAISPSQPAGGSPVNQLQARSQFYMPSRFTPASASAPITTAQPSSPAASGSPDAISSAGSGERGSASSSKRTGASVIAANAPVQAVDETGQRVGGGANAAAISNLSSALPTPVRNAAAVTGSTSAADVLPSGSTPAADVFPSGSTPAQPEGVAVPPSSSSQPPAAEPAGASVRVLIVDDVASTRKLMARQLRNKFRGPVPARGGASIANPSLASQPPPLSSSMASPPAQLFYRVHVEDAADGAEAVAKYRHALMSGAPFHILLMDKGAYGCVMRYCGTLPVKYVCNATARNSLLTLQRCR